MKNDLSQIQTINVNMLLEFKKIVDELGLTYYITGGSLIGVLRHGGFIPWDDDIDIALPRKDYEILLNRFSEVNTNLEIVTFENNKQWNFALSQIINPKFKVRVNMTQEGRDSYVWLDIFPLDGLPNGSVARKLHLNSILFKRFFVQMLNITTQVDNQRNNRPTIEKVLIKLFSLLNLSRLIDSKKVLRSLDKTLKKFDMSETEFAGNLLGRYRKREVVPSSYFGIPSKGLFEGIEVSIPQEYHKLQTALYGDYMELPPEAERVGHFIDVIES